MSTVEVGDVVVLPTTEFHGWPRLLVEKIYTSQADQFPMAMVCWFDKNMSLHRAEFRTASLQKVSQ